ncbi:MAG: uracil-DNA glycosylase family protein [Spirochaetaceae bacterium]
MQSKQSTDFQEFLELFEDYLVRGYRRPRDRAPESPAAGSGSRPVDAESPSPADSLEAIREQVLVCTKCPLAETRTHAVPGEGVPDHPLVMIIGEGPGADEDAQGRPFVGKAGQYLDKWLAAVDLSRDTNVFITNIVKCRPPNNRDPKPDEIFACRPYLRRQIALIRPKAILTLGRFASAEICNRQEGIGRIRGRVYSFEGVPVVPTYHPSGVLRNPEWRRPVWDDLRKLRELL